MNTTAQALSAPFAQSLPNERRHRTGDGLRRLLLGSVAFGTSLNQGRGSVPKPAPAGNRKMRRAAKLGAVTGAAASLLMAGTALANPTGGTVAAGTVSINASTPGTLNITQSTNSAIINWQSFNIGAGETTNFQLPNASGVTLNRVTGTDPSAIFGTLTSNGTIFLVNPNGVFFGAHSKVDAAGIVATTANISDSNFLAGNYAFTTPSTNLNAAVVNEGDISIADRGLAALVAPSVRNSGVIQAKLGRVALGGANSFTLDFWGDGLLSFGAGSAVTTAPKQADGSPVKALVTNTGKIVADGGTVELSARTVKSVVDQSINTDGIIEAKSVGTHNGNIVLGGGDAGTVEVAGTLDASGTTAGATGGTIQVNGAAVDLEATAKLDSSGAAGGGKIRVGSNAKGKTAATVTIAKGATVNADALVSGTGGAVSIISNQSTVFAGTVTSRGGAQGGDGGAVEISGHNQLSLTGAVDLTATKGKTGNLLLDPSSIEITDTSSSSNTGSVVTRGWLTSQANNANITLSATGLITVDAMAGHLINLATTAGNSFTLQSTSTGGITFVDPTTEIRTAGGSITLQAQGDGSLTNIGLLTSNGGAISLSATRNIQLAGAVNAGAGAVTIKSDAGAITNPGGNAVTGSTVSLQAIDGSIGTSSASVAVATSNLSLVTGGDIYVADSTALSSLAINSIHSVAPANNYQLTAPGLTFAVTDANSVYSLTNITSATPLTFSFTGDNGISVGIINIGSGALSLTTTTGNIVAASPSSLLTAGSIALTASATGSKIGAITTSAPINTATATLNVIAGTGGADISNTGALALPSMTVTGAAKVASTGDLTVGSISVSGSSLALASTGGAILHDSSSTTSISTGTLSLQAATGIGTSGRIVTNASQVSATSTSGDIDLNLTGSTVITNGITAGNGAIDLLSTANTLEVASIQASGANNITIVDTVGSIDTQNVITASGGTVTLTASNGSIQGLGGTIQGSTILLTAAGSLSSLALAAPGGTTANVSMSAGSTISVTTAGSAVTLNPVTSGSSVTVTANSGDLILGTITATGAVTLKSTLGNIFGSSASVTGSSISLTAGGGSIGASGNHIAVGTTSLTLSAFGNIYLDDSKPLSALTITDDHLSSAANILALTAPYLTFDVTDSGSQMTLSDVTSANLASGFRFTTDEPIVVGQIRMPISSVTLVAANDGHVLNPDIFDDSDPTTRITASSVTLTAAGNIGSAGAPVQVDTTSATLTTHENLYLQSIADLSTLNVTASHVDPTQSYVYQVTAPSLTFAVTDALSGYTLTNVSDVTGLSFSFTGDRALTVGTIDVTPIGIGTTNTGIAYATSGSVSLSGLSISDDGDSTTLITGKSVSLRATAGSVGSLSDRIGVVAEAIGGGGTTGFDISVPTVANTTQHAVVLTGISSSGPIDVLVASGDVQLGSISATNGSGVTIDAADGAISAYLGASSTLANASSISASSINLTASGAIGSHTYHLNMASPLVAATSGGGLDLTDTSTAQYTGLTAAGAIELTASGTASLGAITAGANPITISAGTIAALSGESLTGSTISLTATSAIGTSAAPLAVATTSLSAANGSGLFVSDSDTLSTLALTFNGTNSASAITAPGQSFTITPSSSNYLIQSVTTGTPLNFSFTSGAAIQVGAIATDGGAAALASTGGAITDDGDPTTFITAPTVSLSAAGSIGDAVNAIALSGTSALTLKTGGNIYVTSDTALATLALTETATAQAANVFAITAPTDTITITDDGTSYQDYLQTVSGTGLTDFSFTGVKNLEIGTIAASHSVSLTTANDGTNGNAIAMDGVGGSAIAAPTITLTATNGAATQAAIGTSGTRIAVTGSALSLISSGNIYVTDSSALTSLALSVSHTGGTSTNPDPTNYAYAVSAPHLTFSVAEGSTETISNVSDTTDNLAFAFTTDRALAIGTIHVGSSASTGSVALTSTTGSLSSSGSAVTAGSVSLSATAGDASVGTGGGAISVATPVLSIATGANAYVSDSSTLTSLSLATSHPGFTGESSGEEAWTYSVSAPGLTFTTSDQEFAFIGNIFEDQPATFLSNIAATGPLAFSFTSDRTIEVGTITLGTTAGNSVALTTSAGIYHDIGTTSTITADSLTLNAEFIGMKTLVGDDDQDREIYTAVNKLSATATGFGATSSSEAGVFIINSGNLAIGTVSAPTTIDIKSSTGSLTAGSGENITATNVVLEAATGSLGTSVAGLATVARYLALTSGDNVYVADSAAIDSLAVTSTHTAGVETFSIAAPGLTPGITDDGAAYTLTGVGNARGLDFTFSGDEPVKLGNILAGPGRGISITSTTGAITDDTSDLTGETITLVADLSIGTGAHEINTNTTNLSVTTGGDVFVSNSLDLGSLSFRSNEGIDATARAYSITAPNLSFGVTTDGTTTSITDVTDTTGLNLSISTAQAQSIATIDTTLTGTVNLFSDSSILGNNAGAGITAANVTISNEGAPAGSAVGSMANPIELTAPLVSLDMVAGGVIVDSTHIDTLGFVGFASSDTTVASPWVSVTAPNSQSFSLDHGAGGYTNASANDTGGSTPGMTLNVDTEAQSIAIGSINLGAQGNVTVDTTGSITQGSGAGITAATVNLFADGAIGASGTPIKVSAATYSADSDGANYTSLLNPSTSIGSITAGGPIGLTAVGDIALGSIDAEDHAFSATATAGNGELGSILSGSIIEATTVTLTADGGIGTLSTISTNAEGLTTTLNATAAAHGGSGGVAVSESYFLDAASISASGKITLFGGYGLSVGTINANGNAVTLTGGTSQFGSITGDTTNLISGSSVTLTAGELGSGSIGTSGRHILIDTPVLTVSDPQDVYISDSVNLTNLTLTRAAGSSGSAVGGNLSISATGAFSFSGSDNASALTLTTVTDSSALDLTVNANDTIQIGTINLTSSGIAVLNTAGQSPSSASIVAINGGSLLTAGTATLHASGTSSSIGSSGSALGLAVSTLNATAGTGGVYLTQAGSLSLASVQSGGDLVVTASTGDLTIGSLSYGSGFALSLTAAGGSILNGNPTGTTISGGTGSVTLSAANGIGTSLLPLSLTATGTVNLTDTGTGSIYVSSTGGLNGGLTVATNNGSANLTLGGSSTLTSLTSSTDAVGDDLNVTLTSGTLTVGSITAGINFDAVRLTALAGSILGANGSNATSADAVYLIAGGSIGSSGTPLNLTTPQVFATTTNTVGSNNVVQLAATGTTVLADLQSAGAAITVTDAGELFAALVNSSGGTINLSTTGAGANLIAGSISAGNGGVTLNSAGSLLDDGLTSTLVSGGALNLTAATAIGTSSQSIETAATTLTASETGMTGPAGIFIADSNANGVTLSSIVAADGAIGITTAGPTIATTVTASTDAVGDNVSITAAAGNLTIGTITAGTTNGAVTLAATTGSILSSGTVSTNVTAHDATLSAANGIGTLTNFLTGGGLPITLTVTTIDGLTTTAANSVISVSETGALTLGADALSLPTGSETYLQTSGNLDASAGLTVPGGGSLALVSGGTLTLPASSFSTTGSLYLSGATDVVVSGGGPIVETAASLKFRSGGSADTLDTTSGIIDAAMTGTGDLTISNIGALTSLTLATNNGDVRFTNDRGFTATSVTAGGTGHTISLTATTGDLAATSLNAGSTGIIDLTATAGSLTGSPTLTTGTLNLVAATAIGTVANPFTVTVAGFSAQVTGTGDIHIKDTGALALGATSTHDGNIVVTAGGTITASSPITAGNGGNITLASTGGNLDLTGTITTTGTDTTKGKLTLAGQTITVGSVTTVGSQTYVGATTIGGTLTGASILITGNATLSSDDTFDTSAANGTIQVTGTLAGGNHGLTLTAGTGAIILGGGATGLTTLDATGGQLTLSGVTTTGEQTYTAPLTLSGTFSITGSGAFTSNGPTTLAGATTVTTSNGAVLFGSTVDGSAALTINAGSSDISFDGAVGGTTRLGALTLNSTGATTLGGAVKAASVTTNAGGTLVLDGGLVDTTGAQSYGEAATLSAATTLNATTASFGATLDGAEALTVNGNAVFGAAVGGTTVLSSVAVSGGAAINGGTVTTTGAQTYGNGSSLGANSTLTATLVSFGTLNDAAAGQQSLTVAGNALFGGAVGGTTALKTLSVSGTSTIDAAVTTVGTETYAGAVTLGGDAALTTTNAAVGFGATVDGGHGLTIGSGTGGVNFAGAVGGTTALASLTIGSGGTVAINGGLVDTTGAQSYGEAATLGAATTLDASTASFGSTLNGAEALTVNGNAMFGGTTALNSVAVTGSAAINGGTVTTTGAQSYGNGSTLGANTTLTGTLVTFGTLDDATAGQESLTIAGNALFGGTVGGTKALKALSVTGGSTLDANVTTVGTQSYAGAVLLASDPVLTTTNAAVAFGSTLDGTQLLTVSTGAGNVTFTGAIGGTARLGALTVDSSGATVFDASVKAASVTTDAGGTLAIDGGLVDTTGAQSYGEATTLGADTVLNATTASFGGTVDAATAGQQGLTVNGNALFGGAVGGANSLKALAISGTSTIGGNIATVGAQSFTGAITLGGDATLATTNAPVTFASTIDGAHALTIDSGSGGVTFDGAIGATAALATLTIGSGGTLALDGGSIATTGAQSYGDAVVLGTGMTLVTTNGAVTFDTTVDGAQSLTVSTGSGAASFDGAVGGATRLGALTVDSSGATTFTGSVKAASVTTDAAGTLAINGGLIDTTGAQSYGEAATLGADTTLNATTVAFGGALDAASAGQQGLTVIGNVAFGSTVGGTNALKALNISGASTIDANIATVGAQSYAGAVTLGSSATLTAANSTVTFASTVDGAHALTVNSGTGATMFAAAVGSTTRLGALIVDTSGATIFNGTVKAASVTTDAPGTLAINGGLVDTTGAQSYGEVATLGADTTLNATTVAFGGTLDGAHALTVNGNASFGSTVGAGTALKSIAVSGGATFGGASVTTIGAQSYGNGSILDVDSTLNATLVSFSGSLDGDQHLTIPSNAAFDGVVGGNLALNTLLVGGTTELNGATITTVSNQLYGGAVTVGGNSALLSQNASLGFASTIDSSNRSNLGLSAINGNITVIDAVGSTGALGALSIANVQNVNFNGAINAASLAVTASGVPQFLSTIFTDGTGGITLTGNSFTLLNPITATAGALTVNLGTGGTLVVGPNAPVTTATGVIETQTGPSTISLASNITSQDGPINFQGSPTLIGSALTFQTNGLIGFTGLAGASTDLTLIAGPSGDIVVGQANTNDPAKLAILKSLTVPLNGTGFATLYGTLGGDTGVLPSSEVRSPLRGARYTYNTYPWGPLNLIGTITVTVPTTTPVTVTNTGLQPGILEAGLAPSLLTVAGSNDLLGVGQSPTLLSTSGSSNGPAAVFGTSEPENSTSGSDTASPPK